MGECGIAGSVNHIMNVVRTDYRFVLIGCEISTPDCCNAGVLLVDLLRKGNSLLKLRTGHYRTSKIAEVARVEIFSYGDPWVLFQVTVNKNVLEFAMNGCSNLKDRIRDTVLSPRTSRIEEDYFFHGC